MNDTNWKEESFYYSGQGVLMAGGRDAQGRPTGFTPLGNVSDLKLTIATTVLEHKESQSGQRGVDKRLQTETKVTYSSTVENFIADNLALATRGTKTENASTVGFTETIIAYPGKITALTNILVSNVVLKEGTTDLVAYVSDDLPWDYKVNEKAGSVLFNDAFGGTVVPITGITTGATTTFAVASTIPVGTMVTLSGFAGVDASLLNGKTVKVTASTAASFTVAVDTDMGDITTGASTQGEYLTGSAGVEVGATYDYEDQYVVDTMTKAAVEVWIRFEGLNTADNDAPVVVDIFKVSTDPLKEMALISDTIQQFVLEGSVLADATKKTGSPYFKVKLTR